jgi:hypothetical protein
MTDAEGRVRTAKTLGAEADSHSARHLRSGPDEGGNAQQTVDGAEEREDGPATSDADAKVAAAKNAQAQRTQRSKKKRR